MTPRLHSGQAAVEYLIVLALFVLVLVAMPDSPVEQLFAALGERYQRFTHAMSMP